MAYNNGFPMNYPQVNYPMNYPQLQSNSQQQSNSNLIWVQGEAGAKSYLVAPNNTVTLWDSEAPVIYLKSTDISGMPSMKTIDYTVREQAQAQKPIATVSEYATQDELKAFEEKIAKQIEELKGELGA